MRERISRFYRNNRTKIILGSAAVAATAVLIARHKDDGLHPIGATVWTNPSGDQVLSVAMSNGERFYLPTNHKIA